MTVRNLSSWYITPGITGRNLIWGMCFLAAFIAAFFISGRQAPSTDLDSSWQTVLEYAFANKFQFGKEIVFTYGPLGFLNATFSQGHLIGMRTAFALFWSLVVSLSVTGITFDIRGWPRYLFFFWFIAFTCLGTLEYHGFLVIAYFSRYLLYAGQEKILVIAVSVLTIAVLALIKFTFFSAAVVSIVICGGVKLLSGEKKTAGIIAFLFMTALMAIWLASAQEIAHLMPYIRNSFEISAGYTEAMAWPQKPWILPLCLAVVVIFLCSIAVMFFRVTDVCFAGFLCIITIYLFLIWKHGLVRGDDHVLNFILSVPLLFGCLIASLHTLQTPLPTSFSRRVSVMFLAVTVLCAVAADVQKPSYWRRVLLLPQQIMDKAALIANVVSGDFKDVYDALKKDGNSKKVPALSLAKSIIGDKPVDVMNFQQSAAVINGFRYQPRPVIQGYSAYTPYLQQLNLAYFKRATRPQFVLFKMETIDSRFPTLDDAALLEEILFSYRVVASDGGYLVLQDIGLRNPTVRKLVLDKTVSLNEVIDLTRWNDAPLCLQVDVPKTFAGKVSSVLYFPPIVGILVRFGAMASTFRLPTAMASNGFLLSPIVHDNDAVIRFLSNTGGLKADSVKVVPFGGPTGFLPEKIHIKLFVVNKLMEPA